MDWTKTSCTEAERALMLAEVLGQTMPGTCAVVAPQMRNYLGVASANLQLLRERIEAMTSVPTGPDAAAATEMTCAREAEIAEMIRDVEEAHLALGRIADAMAAAISTTIPDGRVCP